MSIQRQRRRGTAAENAAFTGALGEFIYVTDGKRLALHDGSTAGGTLVPSNRDMIDDYFGYGAASGTDTITLTVLAQITAYAAGQTFTFKAAATNTGSATLNVNSLGAKTIKKKDTSSGTIAVLEGGDIIIGGIYTVRYDGTDMQLISTDGGGAAGWEVLARGSMSGASLNLTSLITSSHDVYRLYLKNVVPATDNVYIAMRTSTDNGSTWDSGATAYDDIFATDNDRLFLINTTGSIGNASGEGFTAEYTIINPLGTNMVKMIFGNSFHKTSAGAKTFTEFWGTRNSDGDIDAIQIFMESGNITSGQYIFAGLKV